MRWSKVGVVATVALSLVALAVCIGADVHLARQGRGDLLTYDKPESWTFLLVAGTSLILGTVLAWLRPANRCGWAFLFMAAGMLWGIAVPGELALVNLFLDDGNRTFGRLMAMQADIGFVWLLAPIALILLLTPTGHAVNRCYGLAAAGVVPAAVLAAALATVSLRPNDTAPFVGQPNPWAVADVARFTDPLLHLCIYFLMLTIPVGAASLFVRFRKARGDERRRLSWLIIAAAPVPFLVAATFVSIALDNKALISIATWTFVVGVMLGAGLSVLRFQLYDVERYVTRALTYALLSSFLLLVYAVAVFSAARVPGNLLGPRFGATAGAAAAAVLFLPMRNWLQDSLDRRFNRRRHRAEEVVRRALADSGADVDVDSLIQDALGDASAFALLADDIPGRWVRADGREVQPRDCDFPVTRSGVEIARIRHSGDGETGIDNTASVRAVAELAAGELDNVRLVAHLRAARQRLLDAQLAERRRIERDLHDGAQQSLLALAFTLRAAEVSGDPERMRAALRDGTTAAGGAVRQLRELANGLNPESLADGGLSAAFQETARRATVPVEVSVEVPRFADNIELTAWFLVTEAVVNAQKHSGASALSIAATVQHDQLHLVVADNGVGGADRTGSGLRGLRDRAEAAGGTLSVGDAPGGGTILEAVLPCES